MKKGSSKDEKDEIIPISNTTKLSYSDVLVTGGTSEAAKSKSKGTVNENNDEVI